MTTKETNLDLEEIVGEYEKEGKIDLLNLDKSSQETHKLFPKYLKLYSKARLKVAKLKAEYNKLKILKRKYFKGELNGTDTLKNLGWEPYQYILSKTEIDEMLEGDPELTNKGLAKEYAETLHDALDKILWNIKDRSSSVRNSIEFMKLQNGL